MTPYHSDKYTNNSNMENQEKYIELRDHLHHLSSTPPDSLRSHDYHRLFQLYNGLDIGRHETSYHCSSCRARVRQRSEEKLRELGLL